MERAAVVGVWAKGAGPRAEASLAELKRLLETAGGTAVRDVVQERPRPDPATLLGRGKVEEIANLARQEKLSAVVIDAELSPTQQRNLQEIVPAKIIDRTRLILDIFAQRARTREGKLQVELAQLNYMLPRATEKFGRFEQQTGGIGTRGPGERKLEISQRRIRDRIARLRQDIETVGRQRALRRENRHRTPLPLIALVGYTNAGKSTLLNALHTSPAPDVYADDRLFATLDPTTRRVKLPGGRMALLVDTVGFIQNLPHHLVAAFRATLEEARDADLLLHVVDAADPAAPAHADVVIEVLTELGAAELPRITIHNKADALSPAQRAQHARRGDVLISARTGLGLPALLRVLEGRLDASLEERTVLLPHARRDLLPLFYAAGRVLGETPAPGGTRLRAMLGADNWGRFERALIEKEKGTQR